MEAAGHGTNQRMAGVEIDLSVSEALMASVASVYRGGSGPRRHTSAGKAAPPGGSPPP